MCTGSMECELCCQHNQAINCSLPGVSEQNCACPFKLASGCVPAVLYVTVNNTNFSSACYADDPNNVIGTSYFNNPQIDLNCIDTETRPCLHILFLSPNTPCSGGICSRVGTCVEQFNTQGTWCARGCLPSWWLWLSLIVPHRLF